MNNKPDTTAVSDIDKATQNKAIVIVVVIIILLFVFSAFQTGMLHVMGCLPIGAPPGVSDSDTVSGSDRQPMDIVVPDEDELTVSVSDVVIRYYPEVHIDGIILPEEYGAGLFDADAAMWLINEYRRQNGLYELSSDDSALNDVTLVRLSECMELFDHTRPDGSRFFTVYDDLGIFYLNCAENLAMGQFTAEEVVRDWIESDTHRANLLADNVTHMSVKVATDDTETVYWVFEAYSLMPDEQ